MKTIFGWLLAVLFATGLLAACGSPDEGPPLGDFPALTKKETDEPFTLTAPSSKSPAAFRFTSSNLAVATISGSTVTIVGPGETIITAAQDRIGSFGPTSKTTTLTVTAEACTAGQVRIDGACLPCVTPAAITGGKCVAPRSSAATVTSGGRTWMGATVSEDWTHARDFCRSAQIDGSSGWRLPTPAELADLQASGNLANQNWALGPTWSDANGTESNVASHVVVNLTNGARLERADTASAYITCVR